MIRILFLLLAATASAAPIVLHVTPQERARIVSDWRRCNPSGQAYEPSQTGSMRPLIDDGDWVLEEAYIGQKLKGEIPNFIRMDIDPRDYHDFKPRKIKVRVIHDCYWEDEKFIYTTPRAHGMPPDGYPLKSGVGWVVVAVIKTR